PLLGHGKTDKPPPVDRHKIDDLGRYHLSRANEIALVLTVLVVNYDYQFAVGDIARGLFYGSEWHLQTISAKLGSFWDFSEIRADKLINQGINELRTTGLQSFGAVRVHSRSQAVSARQPSR